MRESGIVKTINNNTIVVEVTAHDECTKCSVCKAGELKHLTVTTDKAKTLKEGDNVTIDINSKVMVTAYYLIYGIPLAVFTATILLAQLLTKSPLISFCVAILATTIAYIFAARTIKNNPKFIPNILPDSRSPKN